MWNTCKLAGVTFYSSRDVTPRIWLSVLHNKCLLYCTVSEQLNLHFTLENHSPRLTMISITQLVD